MAPAQGPRVLLIDDAPGDRALAARELSRGLPGLALAEAADAAAAERALGGETPGLVITAARLHLVQAVRARWPDCPLIAFDRGQDVAVLVELARAALSAAARREGVVEELRRALRARDSFLQVASHELRNPLNALVLHVEALARDPEVAASDRLRQRLARAQGHVGRLVDMVDVLLDLSMLEAGRVELRPASLDLVAVVRALLERLEPELRASGCEARLDAAAPCVEGAWDPVRLEQVLLNLLSNASKFGAGRPIEVAVTCDGARDEVAVSVTDHGPGIPLEAQARIFERLERAVSERDYAGMGLGLWIARELTRAMGGRLQVSSRPGEGARFEVVLPRSAGKGSA